MLNVTTYSGDVVRAGAWRGRAVLGRAVHSPFSPAIEQNNMSVDAFHVTNSSVPLPEGGSPVPRLYYTRNAALIAWCTRCCPQHLPHLLTFTRKTRFKGKVMGIIVRNRRCGAALKKGLKSDFQKF
ncbi:unnamed protein product [Arctia plantaginis]|uniref:Uncharacterized protein n=1 Tax=Arctia plantaginis TaxID=874455 RepID=A0A8S0Z7Y2_ARCPL|nr:unnamed protein product [Arctia plantaginis]CAB3228153.1 unnamed protein product [Arctia plantaginis]